MRRAHSSCAPNSIPNTMARVITNLYKLFPSRCAHILQLCHQQLLRRQPHLQNKVRKPEQIKDDLLDFASWITSRHLSCHFMARISTRIRLCFPDPGQKVNASLPNIFNGRISFVCFGLWYPCRSRWNLDDKKTGNSTPKKTYFFLYKNFSLLFSSTRKTPELHEDEEPSVFFHCFSVVVEERGPIFFLLKWYYFSDFWKSKATESHCWVYSCQNDLRNWMQVQ